MEETAPADHPDRLRWNARYTDRTQGPFTPHPLAERALAMPLPDAPVLDLACGPSGSTLLAASTGRRVTAVDIADVALDLLGSEVRRRNLADLVTLVHADLEVWRPGPSSYSLVLCTGYWERPLFPAAVAAVAPGGVLAWEAFTLAARQDRTGRPGLPPAWCLGPGEPATLLPPDFTVLACEDVGPKRRLLAVRRPEVPPR
ncbi:MAG: class I SAM-dependent methyltransferase [Actinoallomurus sp.]